MKTVLRRVGDLEGWSAVVVSVPYRSRPVCTCDGRASPSRRSVVQHSGGDIVRAIMTHPQRRRAGRGALAKRLHEARAPAVGPCPFPLRPEARAPASAVWNGLGAGVPLAPDAL